MTIICDVLKTNRCIQFENILKTAKFKLCTLTNDDNNVLNKEVKTEMKKQQRNKMINYLMNS